MQIEEANVDWISVKKCLAQIGKSSREFFYRAVLIGGAAAFFYRNILAAGKDLDFKISGDEKWVSRDIDFGGISTDEALLLLGDQVVFTEKEGRQFTQVAGVRIGVAQTGVTFTPEDAFQFARVARIQSDGEEIEFLVLDPLTLYYEKSYLRQKRGAPNDKLHVSLLHEYICYELVQNAMRLFKLEASPAEARETLLLWKRVGERACEILQDSRLQARLKPWLEARPDHEIALYIKKASS